MKIHSLFNDVGLSIASLLDNHILQDSKYIKRYEFNTGTRTFQLDKDYKTNFDLPTCMITVNDETPHFGQRPEVLLQQRLFNINQIPVLHNKTLDRVLFLQEESTMIPITASINCESQFQAKELSHQIKRFLPLGKWIEVFNFRSFIEVSKIFLTNIDFNPNEHVITNLFSKPNNVLGEMEYCFSVNYKPQIRLDNISASSPDSGQRSFGCTMDVTYVMQWPMFLYSTANDKAIESLNLSLTLGANNPILDMPTQKILNPYIYSDEFIKERTKQYTPQDIREASGEVFENAELDPFTLAVIADMKKNAIDFSKIKGLVKRNLLISDEQQYTVRKTKDWVYLIMAFEPTDFKLEKKLSYNVISKDTYLYDFKPETLNIDDNKITFKFDYTLWDQISPNPIRPILIQFYDPTIARSFHQSTINISVS